MVWKEWVTREGWYEVLVAAFPSFAGFVGEASQRGELATTDEVEKSKYYLID